MLKDFSITCIFFYLHVFTSFTATNPEKKPQKKQAFKTIVIDAGHGWPNTMLKVSIATLIPLRL